MFSGAGRRFPVEVLQAPHVQTLTRERMHVADDVVLDQFAVDGAEGDPTGPGSPFGLQMITVARARPCDRLVAREFGAQRLDERVARRRADQGQSR